MNYFKLITNLVISSPSNSSCQKPQEKVKKEIVANKKLDQNFTEAVHTNTNSLKNQATNIFTNIGLFHPHLLIKRRYSKYLNYFGFFLRLGKIDYCKTVNSFAANSFGILGKNNIGVFGL